MAEDLKHMFVGPMPVAKFLAKFVPSIKKRRPAGRINFTVPEGEGAYHGAFVEAMHASPFCPGLVFVDTHQKGDTNFKKYRKPDISVFSGQRPVDPPLDNVEWTKVELCIEVKPLADDPFQDPGEDVDRKTFVFEHRTNKADSARGQIASYAHAQHISQFRTSTLSICLMGDQARLIYWDRSATAVSERFNFVEDPKTLAEFFWRFSNLDAAQRGRDTSVTVASAKERERATERLVAENHYAGAELALEEEFFKFHIHDDKDKKDFYFIAPRPKALLHSPALAGRGTVGFIAFDPQHNSCVWVKDSWRIVVLEKEGDIYRLLHAHKVPHIPELLCAGDVLVNGHIQETLVESLREAKWACMLKSLTHHVHYRQAWKTIGTKLSLFSSTKQLCEGVRDAITAHSVAFEKAHVLHRDVSAGNVMFAPGQNGGLLIDWEMAKIIKPDEEEVARQTFRTGTWQFISGVRLLDPKKRHEFSDDLESFVHVLMYHLLRYRPSGVDRLNDLLHDLYNDFGAGADGAKGGRGKKQWFSRALFKMDEWRPQLPTPCANIVEDLQSLFEVLYIQAEYLPFVMPDGKADIARRRLQNATAALKIFDDNLAIKEWLTDSASMFQNIGPPTIVANGLPTVHKRGYSDARDSHATSMSRLTASSIGSESSKRRRTDAGSSLVPIGLDVGVSEPSSSARSGPSRPATRTQPPRKSKGTQKK